MLRTHDPATGTWASTGSLVQPRSNYRATLLADGNTTLSNGDLIVAGGTDFYLVPPAEPFVQPRQGQRRSGSSPRVFRNR